MKARTPNIDYTLHNDLCTGCGICVAVCPKTAISMRVENGRFLPEIDVTICNNKKGCHSCYDVCPGVGVDLISLAKEAFADPDIREDKMVGRYTHCYYGYSTNNDIRYHSASGGMVCQFLIWLLERGKIDGAIVTRFDKTNPLLVESFIATSREEIMASRSSKYAPVSLHKAMCNLKSVKGSRYVVVGLPCHIQGIRKLMAHDHRLKEKVVGLFSLYCSSGRTFNLTEFLFKERGIPKESINYFQYRDEGCLGKMVVKCPTKAGGEIKSVNEYGEYANVGDEVVYKEPFYSSYLPYRSFFIPHRCDLCIDHYGELGDVCFGDIHIKPFSDDKVGVNSLIVRKQEWLDSLEECHREGFISLNEIPFETVSDSQTMSFRKKGRNGAFLQICRMLGRKVPQYDVDYLRTPTKRDWIDFFQNNFQHFIGRHKVLWPIISRWKSKVKAC